MMFDMNDYGWGWMVFGGIHMLLFWIFIILAIVAMMKWLGSRSSGDGAARTDKTALQVLQERYARGEIDREEYLRIKADLDH